jgi:hypothetical protein
MVQSFKLYSDKIGIHNMLEPWLLMAQLAHYIHIRNQIINE